MQRRVLALTLVLATCTASAVCAQDYLAYFQQAVRDINTFFAGVAHVEGEKYPQRLVELGLIGPCMPWLGASWYAAPDGMNVSWVEPGSPLDLVGIEEGDCILLMTKDGVRVNPDTWQAVVRPADRLYLVVRRVWGSNRLLFECWVTAGALYSPSLLANPVGPKSKAVME